MVLQSHLFRHSLLLTGPTGATGTAIRLVFGSLTILIRLVQTVISKANVNLQESSGLFYILKAIWSEFMFLINYEMGL
ncbi:hypothetical protein SZ39_1875 [Bacillus mycoides]|nr:hypothetical protein SZ39_1875 [Bacillus mycoides]